MDPFGVLMKTRLFGIIALLILPIAYSANDDSQGVDQGRLVVYQYALYLLPGFEGDPVETATALIGDKYERYLIVDALDEPPVRPVLSLTMIADAQQWYAPPDMQLIGHFGRGVSREQALAVQESENVLIVDFAYPGHLASTAFFDALTIMEELSRRHESLVWDEATREIFSVEAWRDKRVDTWNSGLPAVQDHTVIHAYKNGEYVRAITLGMEKFGQPDIVVNDFVWSLSRPIGNLINLVGQTLIEGGEFNDDLSLDLDVNEIRHAETREVARASLRDNAESTVTLYFRATEREEGDPANTLLEIRFDSAAGVTPQQQQEVVLGGLFGWEDGVSAVDHNREILAASERARQKLPQLKRDFIKGLEPGEFISVKAPFPTPDGGNEWMWVEVIEWKGSKIRGLLKNEPVNVPGLSGGSEVVVDQGDLFDYIRSFSDGREEGNETGRLIQQYQAY